MVLTPTSDYMEDENNEVLNDLEETIEEERDEAEETVVEKPKRTPQEELDYFEGRAKRLRKKLGLNEEEKKPVEKKVETTGDLTLSPKDALLLAKADVDLDDVDEVVDFANYRKITIEEALKNSTLKAILRDKKEERTTAAATQTRGPRGVSKPTGEALISKASQGQIPEKDADIQALVEAEMARKLQRLK